MYKPCKPLRHIVGLIDCPTQALTTNLASTLQSHVNQLESYGQNNYGDVTMMRN